MTALPPALPDAAPPREPLVPGWAWLRRHRDVTVPAAVPVGFAFAGEALNLTAHSSPADMAAAVAATAVGSAVLGAAVWWAAPHKWDRTAEQWYARLSAILAGSWLTYTTWAGLSLASAISLAAGALAWGIPWWWHKRTRKNAHAKLVKTWAEWWAHYADGWDLRGSGVIDVSTEGVIDTLHVQLSKGRQTIKNVAGALPLIESALAGHVEHGMTRAEKFKGRPDQVLIHLKRENPLDVDVIWDPAIAPERVTQQMPIGKNEGGQWERAPMRTNWFLNGAERTGKSNELSAFEASETGCIDAAWPWIIDLKGGRSARPWTHPGGEGWIAITIEEARLLLAVAVLELRARALHAYNGDEQLEPTPDIPLVRIVIDEANGVTSTSAGDFACRRDAGTVASQGGAVNFRMTVLTQYGALDESVGTEQIRSNLKSRCCFQVTQPAHGQFTLTDWANLDPSRLDNKGEFYWQSGPKVPSSPCRGPRMDHALVRQVAARNATVPRPPLLFYSADTEVPGSGGLTVQEVWDTRWDRCPEQFRPGYTAPPRGLAPPPPPPPRTTRTETPMHPEPDAAPGSPYALAAQIEEDVASLPEGDPPLVDPGVLASQIDHAKHTFARLLADAPPAGVSPTQLITGSGMSKSWVHQMLSDLIKAGAVAQPGRGRYLAAPGRDVWAAIMEITGARAALYVQAKQLTAAGAGQ
jgi:hypothetical protein